MEGRRTLVFGKFGQVASELGLQGGTIGLSRDDANLIDPLSCRDAIWKLRPDAVINASAYTDVDRAEVDEEAATVINGHAPSEMALACAELDIPIVHISTDYVFDGSGEKPWETGDPTGPLNVYGRSKLAGEIGVRAAGGRYAILRTSWVFSQHGRNFVNTILRLAKDRNSIRIVDDQLGGPTPASMIAKACLVMSGQLIDDKGKSGTYHLAGEPDVSWYGFAKEIVSQAKLRVDLIPIPSTDYLTPATRPLNSRLDCSAIDRTFGIIRPNWRLALTRMLT